MCVCVLMVKCVCVCVCVCVSWSAKMCDRQDLSSNNRHFGQPIDPLVTRCLTLSENIILITGEQNKDRARTSAPSLSPPLFPSHSATFLLLQLNRHCHGPLSVERPHEIHTHTHNYAYSCVEYADD